MPLRTFRDAEGVEWKVWSVIPGNMGNEERRAGYDRRSPDPVIAHRGPERRTNPDRRKQPRPALPLPEGWLVFEGGGARRRLCPIPPAWETRGEADLERLCDRAEPVPMSGLV